MSALRRKRPLAVLRRPEAMAAVLRRQRALAVLRRPEAMAVLKRNPRWRARRKRALTVQSTEGVLTVLLPARKGSKNALTVPRRRTVLAARRKTMLAELRRMTV